MAKFRSAISFGGAAVFGIAIIGLVVALSSKYLDRPSPAAVGCSNHSINHKVVILDDKVSPSHTIAQKCDTLTITNQDSTERLIAFGRHDDHVPYDSVSERLLQKNESFTVTLEQAGNFRFHDHEHDEVQGTFTVKN